MIHLGVIVSMTSLPCHPDYKAYIQFIDRQRDHSAMSSPFCCDSIKTYRPGYLQHELKFTTFMAWARFPTVVTPSDGAVDLTELNPAFAIQLVRQVNYGPLESKRYFIPVEGKAEFVEVAEDDLIQANFKKLNT